MADLVVIVFRTEAKAEGVRQKLFDLQQDYLIELGDAVSAVKQPSGRVNLNQIFHPAAAGAASGSFRGLLIGFIFMMPLVGVALGGALADVGINDKFMKDVAQSLQSGNAALFLLVRKMTTDKMTTDKMTTDKVLAALQGEGDTVLRSSFDHTKEAALREALAADAAARPAA